MADLTPFALKKNSVEYILRYFLFFQDDPAVANCHRQSSTVISSVITYQGR